MLYATFAEKACEAEEAMHGYLRDGLLGRYRQACVVQASFQEKLAQLQKMAGGHGAVQDLTGSGVPRFPTDWGHGEECEVEFQLPSTSRAAEIDLEVIDNHELLLRVHDGDSKLLAIPGPRFVLLCSRLPA